MCYTEYKNLELDIFNNKMPKGYFESDTYHTPQKGKLSIIEKFRLDSRIYFTLKYAAIVLRTRKEAIRKEYDTKAWTDSSFEISKVH